MLEPVVYRRNEQIAKSLLPTWRVAQPHNVDFFEKSGFPVRINSLAEVGQLIDAMQENRFDPYMRELGGLTEAEHQLLLSICREAVAFQLTYFPQRRPVLPLSTLMSSLMIYQRLIGFNPGFKTVLEIGPGCGYLAFLLKQHRALENFSEIEACESFYILQSLVNTYCFGHRFDQRASASISAEAVEFFYDRTANTFEVPPELRLKPKAPLCSHYPWWKLGELLSTGRTFEIVTSNANLLEFSPTALNDYLELISRVMRSDGVLVAQCFGWPAHGTLESLLETMWAKKFAPLLYMQEHTPARFPGERVMSASEAVRAGGAGEVSFTVNNAVFIREGHPLYSKYRDKKNFNRTFVAPEPAIKAMYFSRPLERRIYSKQEIIEEVERGFG